MASTGLWDPFGCQILCENEMQCPTAIDAYHRSTCEEHGSIERKAEDRPAIFKEYTEHLWDHQTFFNCEFGPGGSFTWVSTKVLTNLQNLVREDRRSRMAYRVQKIQRFLWIQGDNILRMKLTVMEDDENLAKDIVAWEGFTASLLERVLIEMREGLRKKASWDWSEFSSQLHDQIRFQMDTADLNNIDFIRGEGTVVVPNW